MHKATDEPTSNLVNNHTPNLPSTSTPIVELSIGSDGKPCVDSRDVAARFGKRHADVIRSIEAVKSEAPQAERNFASISYVDGMNRSQRCFAINRDGFTILAMGFTGKEALKWKIAYIAAFNAMEAKIAAVAAPTPQLTQLAALRQALTGWEHAEAKLLTAETHAAQLAGKVEEMASDVAALDRIAKSDGSLCISETAKDLQIKPIKKLFAYMRTHGWIYNRGGHDLAYQARIVQGVLEHKVTVVTRTDGTEKTVSQVRVTPKGIKALAKAFPSKEEEAA